MFAALGLADAATAYRRTTLERFRNPFLRHRLRDIAANHAAKKQRRFAALIQIAARAAPDLRQPRLEAALSSDATLAGQS